MKFPLPTAQQDVVNENRKYAIEWYTFFENVANRVLSNQSASFGGVINNNITSASNAGSGATDLISYTLGKNALRTTADYIEIEAFGTFASNANNKSISLIFGSTTIYSIAATAINGGSWSLRGKVIKNKDGTQEIIVEGNGTNSVLIKTVYTSGAEDLTSILDIKISATGIATDDIVQRNLTIKLYLQ